MRNLVERSFKVMLLGDYAVGKNSLLTRVLGEKYHPEHIPNIETEIYRKEFEFSNCQVTFMPWNLGDKRVHREKERNYCSDTDATVIVFDICRPTSFQNADRWHNELLEPLDYRPMIWAVGNKVDLCESRVVDREEVEGKAEDLEMSYLVVSVKTGENMGKLCSAPLKEIVRTRREEIFGKMKD